MLRIAKHRRLTLHVLVALLGLCPCGPAGAQFQPGVYKPPEPERVGLRRAADHLRKEIAALRRLAALRALSRDAGTQEPDTLADVEIYLSAVDRSLEQNLFFSRQNFDQGRQCIEEGEARAATLKAGSAPWRHQTGIVVLGYRSVIDRSVQPYQVYIPENYDFTNSKPMRLDLFLHGRGGNLNEINFIRSTGWLKGNFAATSLDHLALAPYGRGNNGWRFCGESDVFEALADFRSRYHVDPEQTTLRGFSMGGHGVFHIGLHYPGDWAVISPGAGFVDTKQYLDIKTPLPDWEEPLLHLYDAVDYAANAKDVHMINYVGGLDPKLPQYRLMAEALRSEKAPFTEIIAANTEHRYEQMSLLSIIKEMAACKRAPLSPIEFVTYTLRYPRCKWITIEGLGRHWQRSEIHASIIGERVEITTRNVTSLRLSGAMVSEAGCRIVRIDGQSLTIPGKFDKSGPVFTMRSGKWHAGAQVGLRKKPGLQGPIDDGLFGPLLAVSGTGAPWNVEADAWSKHELARFRECWGRYFRAVLPEATDTSITADDLAKRNLYLFGDPGSNAVLRRILPKLPLRWTRDEIVIKGKHFATKDHLPLLVFPNPESPEHYVVIDTGMTFSRADQEGSNALQYPHLPDYAVIRIDPNRFSDDRDKDTEIAGFFNEAWK